nr:MAG TPA: hypothetical protein [Caudoviricetes sp.]
MLIFLKSNLILLQKKLRKEKSKPLLNLYLFFYEK